MSENNSRATKELGNKTAKIDPLYCMAINFILNQRVKSVSTKGIQRYFNIDYSHAIRLYRQVKLNNTPIK